MPHKRKVKGSQQTKLIFDSENSFLHLEYFHSSEDLVSVPLHTFIPLFVIKYINSSDIKVFLHQSKETTINNPFAVDLKINSFKFKFTKELPPSVSKCRLPCWYIPGQFTCLAGLCSVVRYIIKLTSSSEKVLHECISLLGHMYGCLSAPAEVSTWTKFCEIEMPAACHAFFNSEVPHLPVELSKFETHLDQPIRIHNVRKRMQDSKGKENIDSNINGESDSITSYAKDNHIYAEGPDILISDIILYPCIALMVHTQDSCMRREFPLIMRWFDRMAETTKVSSTFESLIANFQDNRNYDGIKAMLAPNESLYKCDPSRDNNKVCKTQMKAEECLHWWQNSNLSSLQTYDHKLNQYSEETVKELNWQELPTLIHPQAGNLPKSRLERKCQQLQGLALPIIKLAENIEAGSIIVDFCSGGGHLGLLLAYLLPKMTVHMVENKEESLARARERGTQLALTNVWYYQSNIDYYQGNFDIGTSLHACGVATDLVIKKSVDQQANIVTCPCCYGAVQNIELVNYPRSQAFIERECCQDNYISMGHIADQTEKKTTKCEQGELFMDIVDTDRCLNLQENGYTTSLTKITPLSCSPKHNLIVAAFKK